MRGSIVHALFALYHSSCQGCNRVRHHPLQDVVGCEERGAAAAAAAATDQTPDLV